MPLTDAWTYALLMMAIVTQITGCMYQWYVRRQINRTYREIMQLLAANNNLASTGGRNGAYQAGPPADPPLVLPS